MTQFKETGSKYFRKHFIIKHFYQSNFCKIMPNQPRRSSFFLQQSPSWIPAGRKCFSNAGRHLLLKIRNYRPPPQKLHSSAESSLFIPMPMIHSRCGATVAAIGTKSQARQSGFCKTESKRTLALGSAGANSLSAFT